MMPANGKEQNDGFILSIILNLKLVEVNLMSFLHVQDAYLDRLSLSLLVYLDGR